MAFKRRLKFDKKIKHKKKMNILYILVFIVLASFGVGYSYISTQLNVNGTANVTAASWDVHFANLNVTEGSITAETPANITSNTTVEFSATLENPGDFYEFTVDVVNNGTMDAMIDNYEITPELTENQQKYLDYTITYSDGAPLAYNQELKKGTTETLKVRFKYKENSDKTNYPTEDQSFNVLFSVTYAQSDDTANVIRTFLFSSNNNAVNLGNSVTSLGTTYTTYQNVVSGTGNNNFIRHMIQNDSVVHSAVGFVYNNNAYYLKGGGSTYDSSNNTYVSDSIYYEENKVTLTNAFGSSNCEEFENYGSPYYYCETSSINANVAKSGYVSVNNNGWSCVVSMDESSGCDYD